MARDCIKIGTSVTSRLKRWKLLRATFFALTGVVILSYSTISLPKQSLAHVGTPIWLLSIFLIAYGFIPYKRLCRLENNPHQLIITDDQKLNYFRGKKKMFSVPLYEVEQIEAIAGSNSYGIGLKLKKGFTGNFPRREKELVKYGVDIYLPYFTSRACKSLKAYCDES